MFRDVKYRHSNCDVQFCLVLLCIVIVWSRYVLQRLGRVSAGQGEVM